MRKVVGRLQTLSSFPYPQIHFDFKQTSFGLFLLTTGEALKHTTEKPTTAESGEAIVKVMAIPKVNAEAKSDGIVKVTWTSVEENGVAASRYRVICYSTRPYKKPIKVASVRQTEVDIEAFEAGLEYTCSVYGIWDDLVPGIEVLSMNPGVSNSFTIPNTGE